MTTSGLRAEAAMLWAIQLQHGLDDAQAAAVYAVARAQARPGKTVRASAWWAWLARQQEHLVLDSRLHDHDAVALADTLAEDLAAGRLPDPTTAAALRDLPDRAERAAAAQHRQLVTVAGLRGVPLAVVEARYHQLRRQYRADLAQLPDPLRPDPPTTWVTGFTGVDRMAQSCPRDPATLSAIYRLQADPAILPAPTLPYAATDLETSGPPGPDGFDPATGCIIEVGVVGCDPTGAITSRYGELVRPSAAADPATGGWGTGAVDVHGITWDDVQDARPWPQVAPDVIDALTGRILVAHNLRFEQTWLTAHLQPHLPHPQTRPWVLAVDTLALARQHFPSGSHKLVDVCHHLDVPYDHGHRAEHDAAASAGVLFALRDLLATTWTNHPVLSATPLPTDQHLTPTTTRVERLRSGHPALRDDPWLVPAGVPCAGAGSAAHHR